MNQDIEPLLHKCNVAIHTSDYPSLYGDGSLEVEARIYTDTIVSYTPVTGVTVEEVKLLDGTIVLPERQDETVTAQANKAILFYDATTNKYRIKYPNNELSGVLTSKGQILTHDGTKENVISATGITDGYHLVIDGTSPVGLSWKEPVTSTLGDAFASQVSKPETATNATVFVDKISWTRTLAEGNYRIGVSYNWRMSGINGLFKCRLVNSVGTVLYEHSENYNSNSPSIVAQQIGCGSVLYEAVAGLETLRLQFCTGDKNITAFISNATVETLHVN
jgi:hypothetical protein